MKERFDWNKDKHTRSEVVIFPISSEKDLIGTKTSIQDLKSLSSLSVPTSFSRSGRYDVFLSFRGDNTRRNYFHCLYNALEQRGISIYIDDDTLFQSESIRSSLYKAIEGSQIAVIIFSENYATSAWCLDTLTHIMKCRSERGLTVKPIFYHVDPSDMQTQRGNYGEAFKEHELVYKNKVESWRTALSDAAKIPGWEINDFTNSYEAESIKVIVDDISQALSRPIIKETIAQDLDSSSTQSIPADLIRKETIVQDLDSSFSQSILGDDEIGDLESSSSKSIPASFSHSWIYDVFVSHGEDIKNTFVDHLYTALGQQNIYAFRDDVTLEQGASTHSSFFKAIKESKIVVIVFSKNYADSPWCLDDLAFIMKCKEDGGQTVLPIFYDMEPYEVRHQKRKYGEAFEKHNLENNDKVESWRKALSEAANITEWSFNHTGNELECIEEIVGTISQLLRPVLSFTHGLPSSPSSYSVTASYSLWWNHDIFLSFIGEYDSKTFVDHLYSTLIQHGIHTYKSNGIHPHNDSIGPSPLNAIEESKIAIIVFTKNYARSSRCLDDLSYIMKCIDTRGMHVMPIFYGVSSSDVKKQSGEFGKEFDKQEL